MIHLFFKTFLHQQNCSEKGRCSHQRNDQKVLRWQEDDKKRERWKVIRRQIHFTVLILEYFVHDTHVTHVHKKSQWYEEYLLENYNR